jgi:uncharacterized protein
MIEYPQVFDHHGYDTCCIMGMGGQDLGWRCEWGRRRFLGPECLLVKVKMMTTLDFYVLQQQREKILELCKHYQASNVRVFGSMARQENREDSDVDLLIDFSEERSVLDYVALQRDLEMLLSRKVDLVMSDCLHPLIRAQVLREARVL